MRPSSAKEGQAAGDYQLTEHNYDRGYSAVVIQSHVRGWLGRRRATAEMWKLQKQFEDCLRQVEAATMIQRTYRNWRRWSLLQGVRPNAVPPGYLAAANRLDSQAGSRSGSRGGSRGIEWEDPGATVKLFRGHFLLWCLGSQSYSLGVFETPLSGALQQLSCPTNVRVLCHVLATH